MIYVGNSAGAGGAEAGYMEGVIEAAVHAGLPEDYIRSLGMWLPRTQSCPAPLTQQPKLRPLFGRRLPARSANRFRPNPIRTFALGAR